MAEGIGLGVWQAGVNESIDCADEIRAQALNERIVVPSRPRGNDAVNEDKPRHAFGVSGRGGDHHARPGRFAGQDATFDPMGIEHSEDVVDEPIVTDRRDARDGGARPPVVETDHPPARAQIAERSSPELPAADPAANRDEGWAVTRPKGDRPELRLLRRYVERGRRDPTATVLADPLRSTQRSRRS